MVSVAKTIYNHVTKAELRLQALRAILSLILWRTVGHFDVKIFLNTEDHR